MCFLLGVQLENEQRCQQEIEDIKHGLESGSITYDPAKLKFSEEAIEEQKHCVRIADEKVALATQTYDLVSVSFACRKIHCTRTNSICSIFWRRNWREHR